MSDSEWVNGTQVDHFAGRTHEELASYFRQQFSLGQSIHINKIIIHGVDSWHGGIDLQIKGTSQSKEGVGELSGKGVVDCYVEKIAVWSMATHFPDMATTTAAQTQSSEDNK